MNFKTLYLQGKEGKNLGLPTGTELDIAINGLQKKTIITIAAGEKVGKSKFVNFAFVLMPYLLGVLEQGKKVHWIYFSFEMDRLTLEFNFAAFFFAYDYGITTFIHNNESQSISPNYLLGRLKDDYGNIILLSEQHEIMLKEIYIRRIISLFGEYDEQGRKLSEGVIELYEEAENPTGLRNKILHYANTHGVWEKEKYNTTEEVNGRMQEVTKERLVGYRSNNPDEWVIIITDHVRKMKTERNFLPKQNVDKYSEYQIALRNMCGYTFVNIIHTNRNIVAVDRMKFSAEHLYPTSEDLKDTGNLGEDSNVLLTMMNPTDEKYGIKKHFDLELFKGKVLQYPYYRSLHLVSSRDTEAPLHMRLEMNGAMGLFRKLVVIGE